MTSSQIVAADARWLSNQDERAERNAEIYLMKLRGSSIESLAEHFDLTERTICRILAEARQRREETVDEARVQENDRLDNQLLKLEILLEQTNLTPYARIAGIEALRKITETRSSLLGLNRPVKQEVEITHIDGSVNSELTKLAMELGLHHDVIEAEVVEDEQAVDGDPE
jgi:transposase